MRATFIRGLVDLAERDARVLFLTGDLGFMVVEPFSSRFPDRFFNLGVAEQNMVGVASGLAEAGFIPFVYSIATFATLRPYEFIRNGPILQRLPVRIVGVGGGFGYGPAGPTHHGLEDVGALRLQPGMVVLAPADAAQATSALLATWDQPGPVYYRLGKSDQDAVPGLDGRFELGRAHLTRDGGDVLVVAMGSVAIEADAAVEALRRRGVACGLLVVSSVSPPPEADLVEALGRYSVAVTVEAHYAVGGLGSLVAEVVAEHRLDCRLIRQGVRGPADGRSGSERYFHRLHRLDVDGIAATIVAALEPAAR